MLIFHLKKKRSKREKLIIDRISEKLPLDNDDIYVKYNPEVNSYELKTDHKNDEKEYIIQGVYALNEKIKKTKDKQLKRDLKQEKNILNCWKRNVEKQNWPCI